MLCLILLISHFFSCEGYTPGNIIDDLEAKGYQKIEDFRKENFFGRKERCQLKQKVGIKTYRRNPNSPEKTVYVSADILGDRRIPDLLLSNGYIISSKLNKQEYLISDQNFAADTNYSKYDGFPFLTNLESTVRIFSPYVPMECMKEVFPIRFVLEVFLFFILLLTVFCYCKIRKSQLQNNVYVFTVDGKNIYGTPPEFDEKFFKQEYEKKINSLRSSKNDGVEFIYTHYKGYDYKKGKFGIPLIVAIKKNKIIKVVSTKLSLAKDDTFNITAKLDGKEAKDTKIERINSKKYKVHMKFDDQKEPVVIDVPSISLTPFFAGGRTTFIYNTFVSILECDEYINKHKTITKKHAIYLIEKFSKAVGVQRIITLDNEKRSSFSFQYVDQDHRPLTEKEVFDRMKEDENFDYDDCNFTFHKIYETVLTNVEIIVGTYSSDDEEVLKAIYLVLLQFYQLAVSMIRKNRISRFEDIISEQPENVYGHPFELLEVVDGTVKNMIGFGINTKVGHKLNDYLNSYKKYVIGEEDQKKLIDMYNIELTPEKKYNHLTLTSNYDNIIRYNDVTTCQYYDEEFKANISMVFIENITEFKKKEETLQELTKQMKTAYKALNLHKFQYIPEEGKMIVPKEFFESIDVEPPEDLNIIPRVVADDMDKINQTSTIRVIDGAGRRKWFSIRVNGNRGFIFCSNDVMRMKFELETAKHGLALCKFISSPYCIFVMDAEHDKFMRILKYKTPFDVIGVNEKSLSKLPEYILEGKEKVLDLIEKMKNKTYENGHFDFLMQTTTNPTWFSMVITKTNCNLYEGFLLNIDEQKRLEISLIETQKMRDIVMSSAKLSLWTFSDTFNDIPYDISNMNWSTLNKLTTSEKFKHAIRDAFDSGGIIDAIIEIKENNESKWYNARGKSKDNKIIGVICDITELHRATATLIMEQKKAEKALKEKTSFLQNMAHGIRTPMNGIVAMLDMLSMQSLPINQQLIVDMLKDASLHLMQELNCVLQLSRSENNDEIKVVPISILEKIEEELVSTTRKLKERGHKFTFHISPLFPLTVEGQLHYFNLALMDLSTLICQCDRDMTVYFDYDLEKQIFFITIEKYFNDTTHSILFEIITMMKGKYEVIDEKLKISIPLDMLVCPWTFKYKENETHIIIYAYEKDNEERQPNELLVQKLEVYRLKIVYVNSFDEIATAYEENKKNFIEAIFIDLPYKGNKLPDNLEYIKKEVSFIFIGESINETYPCIPKPILPKSAFSIIRSIRFNHLKKNGDGKEKAVPKADEEKKVKVLIVEDYRPNQIVLSKLLNKIGVDYDIAGNGQIAVDKVETAESAFDMIFMDCQMPVMDGLQATKKIREGEEGTEVHVPIVALTASAVEGDEEKCMECGMDGYIQKPFRYAQIVEAIKKYTSK